MRDDVLIISPHPDDAALSLGAVLKRRDHCRVANVFTEQNYSLLPDTEAGDVLAEDRAALAELGVQADELGLPEADVRLRRRPGELMGHTADSVLHPADAAVRSTTQELLRDHLDRMRPGVVFVPLAVGGQVDHVIVREAVLALRAEHSAGGAARWYFYEDLPYALTMGAAQAAVDALTARGLLLESELIYDEESGKAKRAALAHYRTQMTPSMIERVMRHGNTYKTGCWGERIWRA